MQRRNSINARGEPITEPPVKRIAELNLNPTVGSVSAHAKDEQLSPTAVKKTHKPRSKSTSCFPAAVKYNSPFVLEDPKYSFYPPAAPSAVSTSLPPSWEPTLDRAIKAIISIQANHVRSFDTETAGAYTATGFIVDAKAGIILSNRHVVSPAPIIANAILCNYEEVPLYPVYRDPVHDFGFLRFDTSKVKFMDLVEIPLAPEKARVGVEIRVVGNDAGEKLSILAGTLARLDRRAPEYGVGEYNDFNTFYLQAASGTSGGSSGSPVLDIDGNAVALNAGGASRSSSSYYLPLDRVKRALEYVRRGEVVPRGTLQVEFLHQPYDEVRRLGLPMEREQMLRRELPRETGLLVVHQVLPRGPADGILREGDIVVGINGRPAPSFIQLADAMDDHVGEPIELTISRGKEERTVQVQVQDLHSITPDRFVEVGGGVANELSYQLAKSYAQPVGGVYVATSGHMLGSASAWRKSVIVSVNYMPTPNLDAFIEAINTLQDGVRVPVRFYSLSKAYKERIMIMHVDRHWHNYRMGIRNDKTGLWDMTELPPPPPCIEAYKPATAIFPTLEESLQPAGKLMPCFVAIDFHLPYLVDGMKNTQFYGVGMIVDKRRGLVVCDRDTIPISAGDILLTFANSLIIPGKLLYLHPLFNYAVVSYNPALLAD
ncbi:trypsin-like cysteine/serine peptidase domain-containing protein, partial [Syncephalis pseudoplumigaleata]